MQAVQSVLAWIDQPDIPKSIFSLLMAAKPNLDLQNLRGQTVLLRTMGEAHAEELTSLLLDAGANPKISTPEYSALMLASCEAEWAPFVSRLIAAGVDVNEKNKDGKTALFDAADNNNAEGGKLLLAAGANPNVFDTIGFTPLMDAAYFGNVEVLNLLIKSGAKLDSTSSERGSALHLAVECVIYKSYSDEKKCIAVVDSLASSGANTNILNQYGWTPLSMVANSNYDPFSSSNLQYDSTFQLALLFVSHGAELNIKNADGRSPVILYVLASSDSNLRMLKLFLDNGGDPNLRDNKGHTALFYANELKNTEQAKLIKEHGGISL